MVDWEFLSVIRVFEFGWCGRGVFLCWVWIAIDETVDEAVRFDVVLPFRFFKMR